MGTHPYLDHVSESGELVMAKNDVEMPEIKIIDKGVDRSCLFGCGKAGRYRYSPALSIHLRIAINEGVYICDACMEDLETLHGPFVVKGRG